MSREHAIELEGTIVERLAETKFRVELANGHRLVGFTRRHQRELARRLAPGDRVVLEVSPYDFSSGSIRAKLEQTT